jgi:hypothetical protein
LHLDAHRLILETRRGKSFELSRQSETTKLIEVLNGGQLQITG